MPETYVVLPEGATPGAPSPEGAVELARSMAQRDGRPYWVCAVLERFEPATPTTERL